MWGPCIVVKALIILNISFRKRYSERDILSEISVLKKRFVMDGEKEKDASFQITIETGILYGIKEI